MGTKAVLPYKIIFLALVVCGRSAPRHDLILADIVNGLMAIPNLIGLIALRHVVLAETKLFFNLQFNLMI